MASTKKTPAKASAKATKKAATAIAKKAAAPATYAIIKGDRKTVIPAAGALANSFKSNAKRKLVKKALPLAGMKAKDSFIIEVPTAAQATLVQRAVSARVVKYSYDTGAEFATRKVSTGVQVWRIR